MFYDELTITFSGGHGKSAKLKELVGVLVAKLPLCKGPAMVESSPGEKVNIVDSTYGPRPRVPHSSSA